MTVRAVYTPGAATIDCDADVRRAAVLMRQEHVGDLIVTESRDGHTRAIGIITDRDIVVEVMARDADPSEIRVGDTIRRDLVTVREDNGIDFALREMRRAGVRRVPVVNGEGALVGVLSVDDLIGHLAMQLGELAGTIQVQQNAEAEQLP
jgi:CBS domain-containing protein